MKKVLILAALVILAPGLAGVAQADQLFVCQPSVTQNCTSAPGGTAIGGESNLITNTGSFDIGVAGNHTEQNPLLVIVAGFKRVGVASRCFPRVSATTGGADGFTAQPAPPPSRNGF